MSKTSDYKVGYGKPPKHSQFKKGQSGNPKGRRAGIRNWKTEFSEELNELIPITEQGITKKLPKARVVIKSLVTRAIKGDAKATDQLLKYLAQFCDIEPEPEDCEMRESEQAILDRYVQRQIEAKKK